MSKAHYAIQAVVRRTGLSAPRIRVWERRYRAIAPERTPAGRRLYSEAEMERLTLLRDALRAGHRIGQIAALSLAQLKKLGVEMPPSVPAGSRRRLPSRLSYLEDCLASVKRLDARGLESALNRAVADLGSQGVLQRVVAPLVQTIGDLWRSGALTAAHERFSSAALRVFLGHAAGAFSLPATAPGLVVATPSGQIHELGALLVGAAAANLGWRVTYLGAGLPAAEIAGATKQSGARAVALSLVYPEDDPRLAAELVRLRGSLPAGVPLLVGGRAMPAYAAALNKIKAIKIKDLAHLGETLDALRAPARKTKR